jgi:organic hydroperoxide reductase OsmC/OhrA
MKIENVALNAAQPVVEIVMVNKFTYIHIYPKAFVGTEADVEKARLAMEKTKKYCLISNSVNAEIVQHPEVAIAKQHVLINSAA